MTLIIKSDVSFDTDAIVLDFAEPYTRTFGTDLFAAYYLGTVFDEDVTHDYSGNGHTLAQVGSPSPSTEYVDCTNANGYDTGFTATALADGGTITIVGVVQRIASPSDGRLCTAGNSSSNDDNLGLGWNSSALRATVRKTSTNYIASLNENADATAVNEMVACVINATEARAYQRSANFTLSSSSAVTFTGGPTSALSIYLGAARTTGTTASRIVNAAFAQGDHSANFEALYQRQKVYLARYGVDV